MKIFAVGKILFFQYDIRKLSQQEFFSYFDILGLSTAKTLSEKEQSENFTSRKNVVFST